MKLMKNITAILLVLFISTTGMPCFLAEDASRDGTIDLQDVILQVQDFTKSVDSAASFGFRFEKMLNALSSVAGLKNLISPEEGKKSSKYQSGSTVSLDRIYQPFSIRLVPVLTGIMDFTENTVSYNSLSFNPDTPPPRIS